MSLSVEAGPLSGPPEARDQIVVSVVGGQVRIHSLKQAQQEANPDTRQVFSGSPAQLAGFLRDIQAEVTTAGNTHKEHTHKEHPDPGSANGSADGNAAPTAARTAVWSKPASA